MEILKGMSMDLAAARLSLRPLRGIKFLNCEILESGAFSRFLGASRNLSRVLSRCPNATFHPASISRNVASDSFADRLTAVYAQSF